ncbi:MAG: helix-turn-helix domain-containing protein [Pseudomonadota bacterium]
MSDTSLIGTRIRQRRVTLGLKQAELAREAGISASYLNLIEHNRRRIGGKTLIRLAHVLQVETATLRDGAHRSLITALQDAADLARSGALETADDVSFGRSDRAPELERIEEFAGRFPGWAGLLSALSAKRADLERTVTSLSERLANDPQLSDALHEVISAVTSIRSAAAILVETPDLEPAWQMRFHRNLNEDGTRLAHGSEALVRYLEAPPETAAIIQSPTDEVEAFFKSRAFHVAELETPEGTDRIDHIVATSDALETEEAQNLAGALLVRLADDARAVPLDRIAPALPEAAQDPEALARVLRQPMSRILRRLALLPDDVTGPTGFVLMDTTGAILLRKPLLGYLPPRNGVGCMLWPLRETLAQTDRPVRARMHHDAGLLRTFTISEQIRPAGFDRPGLRHAYMLLTPDTSGVRPVDDIADPCRICGQTSCPAAA